MLLEVSLLEVATLGIMCMIGIGLLVAAHTASEEFSGDILNAVTWPMMLLSGALFSLEGTHHWVQQLAQVMPQGWVLTGMSVAFWLLALIYFAGSD